MKLTHEQEAFVEAIRDFAARERFDGSADPHSDAVAARMGELGWYGLQIPEEYGGSGGSFLDATLFLEEFTRGQIPVAAYGVTLIVVGALNRFGSEEQKREHFGHVVSGGTLGNPYSSFGWYFGQIRVSPANANVVVVPGVTLHRSTNGGVN